MTPEQIMAVAMRRLQDEFERALTGGQTLAEIEERWRQTYYPPPATGCRCRGFLHQPGCKWEPF